MIDHILTTFHTISYLIVHNPCILNIQLHFFLRALLKREHKHLLLFELIYELIYVPVVLVHLINLLQIQEVKQREYVVNREWLYVL
ncbi:hypothetical protein ASG65_07820 [Bacillus sp. Leaf13]|nr:hypothetical protein ASG65_07820 [Bacillus sp. Leaf13]